MSNATITSDPEILKRRELLETPTPSAAKPDGPFRPPNDAERKFHAEQQAHVNASRIPVNPPRGQSPEEVARDRHVELLSEQQAELFRQRSSKPAPAPSVVGKVIVDLATRDRQDIETARKTWRGLCEQLSNDKPLNAKQTGELGEAMTILGFDENELTRDVADLKADRAEAEAVAKIPERSTALDAEARRNKVRLEELTEEYKALLLRQQRIVGEQFGLGDEQRRFKTRRQRKPFLHGLADPIPVATPAAAPKVVGWDATFGPVMG
jgi:hypothetical protein